MASRALTLSYTSSSGRADPSQTPRPRLARTPICGDETGMAGRWFKAERALIAAFILTAMLGGALPSIALGIALFAAGLPHGFMIGGELNKRLQKPLYWAGYVLAAGLAFWAFIAAPVASLAVFLTASFVHFGTSDAGSPSGGSNWVIACLAIGGSALFQPETTRAMFGAITGSAIPDLLMTLCAIGGALGSVAAIGLAVHEPKSHARLLGALGLVAFAHPVLAVGAVFFLFHASPVQHRFALNTRAGWHTGLCLAFLASSLASAALVGPSLQSALTPQSGWIALIAAGGIALIIPHLIEDAFDRLRRL